MRKFSELKDELGLRLIVDGRRYSKYASAPGQRRISVRRFEDEVDAVMTASYVTLLNALEAWIVQHPALARLVRVDLPVETGADFVAFRKHVYTTSLDSYDDPEQSDLEIPDELAELRRQTVLAMSQGAGRCSQAEFQIIRAVLHRSLLGPCSGTYLLDSEQRFVIAEPAISPEDIAAWHALS